MLERIDSRWGIAFQLPFGVFLLVAGLWMFLMPVLAAVRGATTPGIASLARDLVLPATAMFEGALLLQKSTWRAPVAMLLLCEAAVVLAVMSFRG